MSARVQPILPAALRPGDRIGVVAPAGPADENALRAGADALRALGYDVVFGESVFAREGYFAGTNDARARDLIGMFERDDVHAIFCARGGYGSNYLLPALERIDLRAHAKPFIGYSDITTLLTRFVDRGVACFHGPMVAPDFSRGSADLRSLTAALAGDEVSFEIDTLSESVRTIVPGSASGILYGGCLSLLVASLGTPFEVQTDDTILFIEDINVWPYQVDRMLRQLELAGKFSAVRAVIFGEMLNCGNGDSNPTTRETVERIVGALGIPIAYGLPSGHVSGANLTLPLGVQAHVEFKAHRVQIRCAPAAQKR
ncbi:MAG TPA: LD-carboxypeptidase [Candidatus Acidoferrales bacterium]|nr:LD-carboxypeptidase [Candidatus Acidoferrales bacterium]